MFRIAVIGSGFSGLSSACYLAREGHEVHVYEKNSTVGGRARQLTTDQGYVFDMGPSWYWMPDVFERFFEDFGQTVSDFYSLKLLEPAFDIVFPGQEVMHVPSNTEDLNAMFESIEKGSAKKLDVFLKDARFKYELGMLKLAYKPGLSLLDFLDYELLTHAMRLEIFSSFSKHVRRYFSHPKLIALMEFPVLFLGAMPQDTPALYSLMNYAGLKLGTWYPEGGFGKVISSMSQLAMQHGVIFHLNSPVEEILHQDKRITGIRVNENIIPYEAVVASSDYHHTENSLLKTEDRNYSESYWDNRTFAPSCLVFYVGLRKKIGRINHHTLFFEADLLQHSREIYKNPKWPSNPLFYVCCPSQSDGGVAPQGHENLFFLMPIAPNLPDGEDYREQYFEIMMQRLEQHVGEPLNAFIDYKKSYCVADFKSDYNAYKGNAYGLANTLLQTANLKPKIKNQKIKHLFYAGQLTVPGPGVPPSLISGKLAAQQVIHHLKKDHEAVI